MDIDRFHIGSGQHASQFGPSETKALAERCIERHIPNLPPSTPTDMVRDFRDISELCQKLAVEHWQQAGSAQQRSGASGGGTAAGGQRA